MNKISPETIERIRSILPKGDGVTDDTTALQFAIDYPVEYEVLRSVFEEATRKEFRTVVVKWRYEE